MGHELAKSIPRRLRDPAFAERYFVGDAIDIGAGDDGLGHHRDSFPGLTSVREWDVQDGDAQYLEGIEHNTFDLVHASHCLEHMWDPRAALTHWLRVLKPGGYAVLLVPDEDMYEQGVFPSTFNPDHKWTFTMAKVRSWSPRTLNLLSLCMSVGSECEVIKLESLHHTYDWSLKRCDQTGGAGECAIEIILRKRPWSEVEQGGRIGKAR